MSEDDKLPFEQFNEARQNLAQHFFQLIEVVGNQVFGGRINTKGSNIIEQINNQYDLVEAEKNLLRNLYYYANNLLESRFFLGVLGRFKAGKSTLLNTLAGDNISPMDTRISTGVLNFIQKAPEEKCIVVFDSGEHKDIDPDDKEEYIDFRQNPDNEKGVHSVRYSSPRLKLQEEIVFVDTPGLEAVNTVHEDITFNFIKQCHAAVVVSTYPPFGANELGFYERIKEAISNTFLVQNLPEDKLQDWVALEAQTLENLHKLKFYEIDDEKYPDENIAQVLRGIGDRKDEQALLEFKHAHNIKLFSLNALGAHKILSYPGGMVGQQEKLDKTRFPVFKEELYSFLSQNKGQKLIENYLHKGGLILNELVDMVKSKKALLQKSIDEINNQIAEQQRKQEKMIDVIDMISDRTKLTVLEDYKKVKNQVLEKDLKTALGELQNKYGEANVFRLRKKQVKQIKSQVSEFNRLLGQRYQEFVQRTQITVESSQQNISQELQNHSLFKPPEIMSTCPPVHIAEISGVGYIDHGFEWTVRGGMAMIVGSISGGQGIALLTSFFGIAPGLALLMGGAAGFVLAIPLEKKFAPALDKCKDFIGRFIHKPASVIFDDFRKTVREKMDEVETSSVDNLVENFRSQVKETTRNTFEMFEKTLRELKDKKQRGNEEAECTKLEEILSQLKEIRQHFATTDDKTEDPTKIKGVIKGIKGFMGKFKKN